MKNPILDVDEGEGVRVTASGTKYLIRLFKGGSSAIREAYREESTERLKPESRMDYYYWKKGFAIPAIVKSRTVGFRVTRTRLPQRTIKGLQKKKVILIPPPPSERKRVEELQQTKGQYKDRVVPARLQDKLDKKFVVAFNDLLKEQGYPSRLTAIRGYAKEMKPYVLYHKNHFKSLRPHELAEKLSIPFAHDPLKTAQTPSYPSGHTAQSYYIADHLADEFPALRSKLYGLANQVSMSRIDRGVHFPSDIEGGKRLAEAVYMLKQNEERYRRGE